MKLNIIDNYFDFVKKHSEYKVIIYGAGNIAQTNYKYFGHIDFFCDQNAKNIGNIENIPCITLEELSAFKDKMIILICIKNKNVVSEVCKVIEELNICAEVFCFFDNPAFQKFDFSKYKYNVEVKEKLKIRIIYLDDGWIFGKFAYKLKEELDKMGQIVEIGDVEDLDADINHYISYGRLLKFYSKSNIVRTSMVTHIDCLMKKDLINFQAKNKTIGICMSSDTMNNLVSWGIPREKLCYINPAQDGEIKPRKIILGITNRCYAEIDFRKRDDLILKICQELEPQYFMLKIMGSGWNKIVEEIRQLGFEVEYYEVFNKELYKELMQSLDYWIYYGFDEGAMGFLDALAAGVKTIATPQGFHLDAKDGLIYPCRTKDDFVDTLKQIQNEKKKITNAVKNWTWKEYARKHLEIWQYLTKIKSLKELYHHQGEYRDGIFSMLLSDINL